MRINIEYPPTNSNIVELRNWCAMLLDEINLAFGKLNEQNIMSDTEKLVNWK